MNTVPACFALVVLAALLSQAAPAAAQELRPFHADGRVGPASDGSGATELGIILEGEMARLVYEAMQAPEAREACTEGFEKRDGEGLVCIASAGRDEYQCSFGLVLGTGKVTFGPLTC